ncbi:MarR family transcriptional regulator [Caballeronia choica]|uniref:MarR family transcriptional regulator n=1 Tax=Caballeronia choica TaxID=326476 RepID=A0A158IYJ9_9BURK|nr:MarR family winged helix-turn-helix transcriptional regulator [Caballeronia choica]SAL61121.1 MarR family transcriptional regulator [Caballeronia choica]
MNARVEGHKAKTGPAQMADLVSQCALFDVNRLARLLAGLYNAKMKDVPLSISQYTLVVNIEALAPARVTDVANAMLMDRTSITRLTEPLIARGLLKIAQGEEDRRVKHLTVTAKGRTALRASEQAWQDAQRAVYDAIGPEQWKLLRKTLRDTVHMVREHARDESAAEQE